MIKVLVFCLVITSTLKQNNCKPLKRQGIENTSPKNIEEETKGPKIPKNSVEEKTKSKDEVKKITTAITTNISRNITEDVKDIGKTDEVLKAETLHETTQPDNSPKKLYTLATMNEAAYNKTAQLIRMVNHADIVPHRAESSKSNQADNLKAPSRQFRRFNNRRPRVKPRHDVLDVLRRLNSIVFNYQPVYLMRPLEDDDVTREDERKYRISNYDVLEMYIKNRRLKNNRNSKNGRGFPKRRNKMNIVQRGEGHHFYDIIEEDNDEDSDDGKAFYNARNDESIARAAADEGYDWADARHDSWPQQSREDEGGLREDSQKLDIDEEDSHKGKVKSILKNNWDYNNAERIFVQMRNKEEHKTSHVKSNDWADSKIEENFSQERQEDKIFAEKGNNSNVKSKKEHDSIKNYKTGKISTYNQFKEEGLSEERTSVAKEQYSSGTKYNKNTKEDLKTQINYQGQQKRSAGSNDLDDKPRRFENDALDNSKPKNRNAPSVKSGKDKINDKAETYDEPDGPEKLDRENWSDKNRDRDRDIERDRDIDRDRIRDGNNDRDKDNDRDRDRDRDLPKASKKSDASFKSRSELKNEKIYKTGKETENKDDDDLKNYKDDYNADGLKSNTKKKEVYNDYKDSYDYGSNRDKKQSNKKTKDEYRNIKETDNKDYYNDRDKKKDSNDWTNKEKKTKKADDNDDQYDRQRVESKSKNNERTQKGHQDYDMLNDKTNDYKDVSKDKSQKSEVNSEKRNIWDRHANNDWDKVGVNNWGDKKAETTRRTTKENINYDFNEPVDTKKRYSDEVVKTSESKANKRQNNKPIKQNDDWDRPLKKVKFERQDNKYDIGRPKKIVNRGGYNSNRGKDRSSNSFPSYGHTPFIYTGGKSVYEEK